MSESEERGSSLRVRILCGAYDPFSPFIEGGCTFEWIDSLDEPGYPVVCPHCGQGVLKLVSRTSRPRVSQLVTGTYQPLLFDSS